MIRLRRADCDQRIGALLQRYDPKLLVIACNTASAHGLPALALSLEPAERDTMARPPVPPGESILGRARRSGLVDIRAVDIRAFAESKHQVTDDTPYGGGAGMVMKPGPFFECVEALGAKAPIVLLSPRGKVIVTAFADSYNQMVKALRNYMDTHEIVPKGVTVTAESPLLDTRKTTAGTTVHARSEAAMRAAAPETCGAAAEVPLKASV